MAVYVVCFIKNLFQSCAKATFILFPIFECYVKSILTLCIHYVSLV